MKNSNAVWALFIYLTLSVSCSRTDEKHIVSLSGSVVPDPVQLLAYLNELSDDYPENAEIMFRKAEAEFRLEHYAQAQKSLNTAGELGKNDHETTFLHSRIAYHLGDPRMALELAEKLAAEEDIPVELNEFLSELYFDQKEYLKSIDQINYCIRKDPSRARYYYQKSRSYLQLKDSVNSEFYLAESLRKGYDDVDAYLTYVELLMKRREVEKAMNFVREAIIAFPENSDIRLLYASSLSKNGNTDSARMILSRLADEGLNSAFLWTALAENYKEAYLYDSALYFSDKAIQMDSSYSKAYYVSGEIHRIRGSYYAAINVYQKLLSIHPENSYAAAEISRIRNYLAYLLKESRRRDSAQQEIRKLTVPVRKPFGINQ